jgi:hypothetical protein
MERPRLFELLIGAKPKGRHIEQHDIFFGIGHKIEDTFEDLYAFWPEAFGDGGVHIDAWREVNYVFENGIHYEINVVEGVLEKTPWHLNIRPVTMGLFFINSGGYIRDVFEEQHEKILVVADSLEGAKAKARQRPFFTQRSALKSGSPHLDDKYGIDVHQVDVDDALKVAEILPPHLKEKFSIVAQPDPIGAVPDTIHLGYNYVKALREFFEEKQKVQN